MKHTLIFTILSTLLFISFFGRLGAQHITNPQLQPQNCEEYIQRPGNTQFVGTWVGSLNGKILQLELKNVKVNYSQLIPAYTSNTCIDLIYGFHKYLNNGIEIENSVGFSNSTIYDKKNSILGASDENNTTILDGTIIHETKNKSIRFKISYLDSTHIKIESLENLPGVRINEPGKPPYDSSIDFPLGIILTKQ